MGRYTSRFISVMQADRMNSLFLKLLQSFTSAGSLEINQSHLSGIKALSLTNNLFPLVYAKLQRYQNSISPEEYVTDFLRKTKALYLKSIAFSAQQESVENEISSLLADKDIPSVVIKGNEVARGIYGDPNCRSSCDVDILIKKTDAITVDALLTGDGYIAEEDIPLVYCLSRIHHTTYRHPGNNLLVEIHWGFGVPYFFRLDSEEIWNGGVTSESGKAGLSPEMIMIMLLIHHHSHSFRTLKILVDILWTLFRYDAGIDWTRFSHKLRGVELIKTTQITLNQIESLWPEVVKEMKAVKTLQREIENMGYKKPGFLPAYFRMDLKRDYFSRIYKDKLMARLALDNLSTTLLSYFKTLFPVPEAIKELYGNKSNWTLPLNYLRFIKWRVQEWMGI